MEEFRCQVEKYSGTFYFSQIFFPKSLPTPKRIQAKNIKIRVKNLQKDFFYLYELTSNEYFKDTNAKNAVFFE